MPTPLIFITGKIATGKTTLAYTLLNAFDKTPCIIDDVQPHGNIIVDINFKPIPYSYIRKLLKKDIAVIICSQHSEVFSNLLYRDFIPTLNITMEGNPRK